MTALVGVVGYGRWGANVVRDLVSLGADVVVAERDDERGELARNAGVRDRVDSAEHLPECDGYVVVTPARSHRDVCEYLLGRDAPVFVEKPPCTDTADVAALAALGTTRLFVMHKWRYHPGIRALAELATSGALGAVLQLETERLGPEQLPPDVDVLWHLGTHDLSIAFEILGAVGPVGEVETTRDDTGRITRCRATMAPVLGAEHRMILGSGVPDRVRRVVVSGTRASARLDRSDATSISVHYEHGVDAIHLPSVAPLAEELRVFLAHLDGGPPPVSDAATALTIARRLSELQRAATDAVA